MVWDFSEGVAIGDSSGSALLSIDRTSDILDGLGSDWSVGHADQASASAHPLPDDSARMLITDYPAASEEKRWVDWWAGAEEGARALSRGFIDFYQWI